MTLRRGLSRMAQARARTVRPSPKAKSSAHEARWAHKRSSNRAVRLRIGPLRERRVRQATAARYAAACRYFFCWTAVIGVGVPNSLEVFDALLCDFAAEPWQEGEGRLLLGNLLSGLNAMSLR